MTEIIGEVKYGINRVINDFRQHPYCYFTEEDVRWRLVKEIENALVETQSHQVHFNGGITSAIHTEYPTPFRCSMKDHGFELLPSNSKSQRGHYDVVVLNTEAALNCSFEVLRSQYYRSFLEMLGKNDKLLPFLDVAIEIKLFRDLAHPNRTESAGQQAEYAVQAIQKIDATLKAAPPYYLKPFAKHGVVLIFDNSDLVSNGNIKSARESFLARYKGLTDWKSLANTLSCFLVTAQETLVFNGEYQIK